MSEKITIEGLIKFAMESRLIDVHTSIVGIVESINSDHTVDVTVAIKKIMNDGERFVLPTIPDVPVCFFGNSTLSISHAIKRGDEGLIIFNERDISSFVESGRISDPVQIRKHEYSDAVFFPVSISSVNRASIPENGIEIKGDVTINGELKTTGEITGMFDTSPVSLNSHAHGGIGAPPTVGT